MLYYVFVFLLRRKQLPAVLEDPSCDHHLYWPSPPETVLVVKKIRDNDVTEKFKTIVSFVVKVYTYTLTQWY